MAGELHWCTHLLETLEQNGKLKMQHVVLDAKYIYHSEKWLAHTWQISGAICTLNSFYHFLWPKKKTLLPFLCFAYLKKKKEML